MTEQIQRRKADQEPFIPSWASEICSSCHEPANKYSLDFFHNKERVRIFSDNTGQVLDSPRRAFKTRDRIMGEIQAGTFRVENYRKNANSFSTAERIKIFEAQKLPVLAPASVAGFRVMVKRAVDFFGDKDVRQVEFLDLENYKMHLEQTFPTLKPKTVKNLLTGFRSFLAWCFKRRMVTNIPPPMPELQLDEPETRWLDTTQQLKLLEAIPTEDREIVRFLMMTGCRIGEARALRIADVNLQTEPESIRVSSTFSGNVLHHRRKTRHDRRTKAYDIAIHSEMMAFIRGRVEKDFPGQYLFPNPRTGGAYSIQALRKIWAKAKAATGINIKMYESTRHSVASRLALAGCSEVSIAAQLGHSSTAVTSRYIHGNLQMVKNNLVHLGLGDRKDSVTRVSLGKK